MVKNNQCVFENLIRRKIIKYRGNFIELNSSESDLLNGFSSDIRNQENFKYILTIPENCTLILRSVITEILYLAVEKDFGTVYFITDSIGRAFLSSMLYEMHTEKVDLKCLLLKFQSAKIKIYENKLPRNINDNDLIVYFRKPESINSIFYANKEICIITLRDIYELSSNYDDCLGSLAKGGWKNYQFIESQSKTQKKGKIVIKKLKGDFIDLFFAEVEALRLNEKNLNPLIESFGYFYSSIVIPLKYYDYCQYSEDSEDFNLGVPPSESISQNSHIGWHDSLILKGVCQNIEQKLSDTNEKYKFLLKIINDAIRINKKILILLPNKQVSDGFRYCIENEDNAKKMGTSNISVCYPESFFSDSLMDEKSFDAIIIPFVPSNEILHASINLSDEIVLCIYVSESSLLYNNSKECHLYMNQFTMNSYYNYEYEQDLESKLKGKTSKSKIVKTDINTHNDYQIQLTNYSPNPDNYSRFLKILALGDPVESDDNKYSDTFIDKNKYYLNQNEAENLIIYGHENVILFRENEELNYRRFQWISPRSIQKNDTIICVPNDLRIKFLQNEIYANVSEKLDDIDLLVSYVSEWKSSLVEVGKKYSFVEVHEKLKKNGLERNYMTISKWFSGLYEDPKKSALVSIIDPKYNIGPMNSEDIKKFGETFEIENLVKNYKTIHAAMATFRTNNQHFGKIAMKKIIQEIDDPEIFSKCYKLKVKSIKIKK
ncbi:hypothetical protein Metlim_0404 [Methanoplanus limicola DSM 2279]|uniref:Uncharacterized protein n=1 Tax=Methanoplanus limicola DSM 2279 TaxID=937775 RepID=H1Z1L7_9EURY|nr:hypothetical protein Metlim_0404 [Methanoplanus limicola DSM 2279]